MNKRESVKNREVLLHAYFKKGEWSKAKRVLLQLLSKSPNDPWLLTRLSYTYYNEKNYSKALELSRRAYSIDSEDPVVIWDYAKALLYSDKIPEAIPMYTKLIRMDPRKLTGKGYPKRWWLGLKNDCRFWLSVCYLRNDRLSLATKYIQEHIVNRKRGTPTECSIREARILLGRLETLIKEINEHKVRLWIALLEVKADRHAQLRELTKYKGAYTNGLVMAKSARAAKQNLKEAVNNMGLRLVSIEDLEEFDRRCLKSKVEPDLKRLATKVRKTSHAQLGAFYTWKR
ncbi:MAG: tetratricopeptide repeat protein [Sedimentisphaerales bacterium]